MICHLYTEPSYLIFVSDVPDLLYYSHLPVAIIAFMVGILALYKGRKLIANRLLFALSFTFTIWTVCNLILWTNIHSDFLLFIWSIYEVLFAFISIISIYLMYTLLDKCDPPKSVKLIFLLLLSPVLLFAHTYASLGGFNIASCDAFGFEGEAFKFYYNFLGLIAILWILILVIKRYKVAPKDFKKQILFMGFGIEFFLLSFFTMTFIATQLANIGISEDSRLEFFGLLGMAVFIVFIGILMTKFKTFKVGIIASQGLVIALVVLVGSQFTFLTSDSSKTLAAITLVLTAAAGLVLNRSVRNEIKQRQEIENLAIKLEKANVRLKQVDKLKSEFVSIASHQLRSPLTSIAGYASLLREGTFGVLPTKMKEPIERIERSARFMAESIEDYLNVSRIESGNMKYHLTDFNLRDEVEKLCNDLRGEALRKGLILMYRTDLTSKGFVNADLGKIQQVVHNLINNSIKYTQRGSITVFVRDNPKNKLIYIEIIDTGIGMTQSTLQSIFQKFERGDEANTVNVAGTGLGLYVAQKMTESMSGTITAYSDGEGKGSRFVIELPLIM